MIEQAVTYLVNTDRFFADFIQQMDRVYTDKIPTLGITVDRRITLYVNPTFFAKWDVRMQAAMLKHEAIHLICGHPMRERNYPDWKEMHQFYNVCMDLSTNCYVPEISHRDGFITVEGMHEHGYRTLQADQPFEYYVGYFDTERQKLKEMRDAATNSDNHDFGEGGGKGESDEVRDRTIKHATGEALEAARRAGQEPSAKIKEIVGRLFKGKNSWRREMRRFPQEAEVCDLESTRSRRNKRYGITYPGHKKVRKVKVGVGVDVSGSMFDEATLKALGDEMCKILDAGAELYLMFFDTAVTDEVEMTKVGDLKRYNHVGGGGTSFQPVLSRCAELGLDGLIMLTDGYNFDAAPLKFPKCPVLWGIINNDNYTPDKGKVIYVKPEERS